ncbi:monovalent cation:proton antiporter family protein [Lacticaseibacillus rhamnosus]|uniref:monovalent cation:proton antiporter family protein n=1 Tax=Lacticaseibacillus rhamnosus TaxID=47715 RepID=UPI00301578CE
MESISLLIVLTAALLTPLLMAHFHINSIPTAVAEILVGIILGKSLLGWVHTGGEMQALSELGVTILIFLSGMEIDFSLFKPQPKTEKGPQPANPVVLATVGFATVIIISLGFSYLLKFIHFYNFPIFATILFTTIALGVVIAALKEQELLHQPLGQTILLIAALGEVIPLISLTIYSALNGSSDNNLWLLLLLLLAALVLLARFKRIYSFFAAIDKSTTQLDIRLAFFLVFTLVTIASRVGAESILGAFLAGMVMKLLGPRQETQDKLTSLGYGFFIPIFFIVTGANLDLKALVADPKSLSLIPLVLIGFFITKIGLIPVLRQRFKPQNALAGTFLATTTITLVIPTLTVGRNLGIVTEQQSGAFTLAAVIACVAGPILFNSFFKPEPETFKKTRVTFIGGNLLTVPIAQHLSPERYEVQLFTDRVENFRTYNSEVAITLTDYQEDALKAAGAYDCDVMVLGDFDADTNYGLAKMALAQKVPRIIARFAAKDATSDRYDRLRDDGVEVFNALDANIALLRSLIETPSTLRILDDTIAGIYEVTIRNSRFAGLELKNLPFIDDITVSQIYRQKKFIAPHGDTQLHLGDHFIFSGDKHLIRNIRSQVEKLN